MENSISVLDDGFVRLVSSNATDLSVVNSARVSFGKQSDEMDEAGEKLIGFLMRERHGTPFEHNQFTFHVRAPIFVVREWFRHRIGWSYNEMSGRYTELPAEAYVPALSSIRTQVGKPGAYTFEQMSEEEAEDVCRRIRMAYTMAFMTYQRLLDDGVAKEVARVVLPVGIYTEFWATTNARALMNFINLRAASNAQWEIQQYANALNDLFIQTMPITAGHFLLNNCVAP